MSGSYISSFSISAMLRQSVLQQQSQLSDALTESSTGRYADVGLQLGASTGQAISLQSQNSVLQTITDTNTTVSSRLSTTQTVLASLQSSAQDFLQSMIQNGGITNGATTLQQTAQANLQSLTANLNTSLNGDYIFAGINTGAAPITDYYSTGAANKTAVDSAFQTAFGMSQSSSGVSGISSTSMQSFLNGTFDSLFTGSNWSSDWSSASSQTLTNQVSPSDSETTSVSANSPAFQQLAEAYTMMANLGTQSLSQDALQTLVSKAETTLQSGITGLIDLQSGVGNVQSRVSSATDVMSVQMNVLTLQIGNLEDVDSYAAATRVNDLQTQIETAYSLTAKLQGLSLVNYLTT